MYMPCVGPSKLVYSISELPEAISINGGDNFIIETLNGPYRVDYDNFIIGLSHTTFSGAFIKHGTDIAELSAKMDYDNIRLYEGVFVDKINPVVSIIQDSIDDLQGYVNQLKSEYNQLKSNYDL